MRVNDKTNVQVRPSRRRDQRRNVEEAMILAKFALDCVNDCVSVGGDVLPGWLNPAQVRLGKVLGLLNEVLREGGEI